MKRVGVTLLNWNNWQDTIECLESLFHLEYPNVAVVVCDNGSTDGSLEMIRAWAAGNQKARIGTALQIKRPPCKKPICMIEYNWNSAENSESGEFPDGKLVLIRNEKNLGFAGGNNVGLRYLLKFSSIDYFWVLNNDTVVAPDALQKLVDRMSAVPSAGICGSTILEYWHPERINALGGAFYSRWAGLAWHLGRGRRWKKQYNPEKVEKVIDYVVGASMFVSRQFLLEVGLMEESYFLYYEELDWVMRARNRFSLLWAPESLVYHKVGGSIGTSSHPAKKSWVSDFYTLRNRICFTRRYYPYALPTVYLGLVAAIFVRILFGQWRRAAMVVRLMFNPNISFEECGALKGIA